MSHVSCHVFSGLIMCRHLSALFLGTSSRHGCQASCHAVMKNCTSHYACIWPVVVLASPSGGGGGGLYGCHTAAVFTASAQPPREQCRLAREIQ